ncbi:hypothetical protein A2W48_00765 [Candidatus Giovannonibacteria bacterium RIFCSPHIGHO2_12_44_12]|uniref:Ribonuclease n=3 Tax=Candidatus Giovannoniibacteriota TaxID=1752738 RepID=A0A1F5X1Y2_9BACT|nr:MAG: hypothetical protein A2W48_00765 [Candidatus Giovannonibacteria bacterium RIFCSPHIGHO2_12_44_12]OGF95739.1 MAG: hypothetical protein A2Y47_02100 [Candidatus Giovannonibacteria bacterium RIFCSPLOWO2_12_43_8]
MAKYIVGVDEAGRGPLAGPVTVGAIAVSISNFKFPIFKNIKDSKKLSAKKREEWLSLFQNNSKILYTVSSVSNSVIDKKGISHALRLAVRRCIDKLKTRLPDGQVENSDLKILLDGSLYAPSEYKQKTIIKGDEKIQIIAAASIIAKVTRDRRMVRLAQKYPQYDFHIHKGYGTELHCKLVKKHGLCDIHRRSYCSRLI